LISSIQRRLTWSSEKFTDAIGLDQSNQGLYSNRSACYASLKQFDKALDDANKATELKPDWAKGWSRKGAALHGQQDLRKYNATFSSFWLSKGDR